MALSIEELELQSAEYLPAREVMSSVGGGHGHGHGHDHGDTIVQSNSGGLVNVGLNFNDTNVLNNVNILGVQNGHVS